MVESKKFNMNHVTLMNDLVFRGQTSFNLFNHNKTCNYDAELIGMSILTLQRPGISEKLKSFT